MLEAYLRNKHVEELCQLKDFPRVLRELRIASMTSSTPNPPKTWSAAGTPTVSTTTTSPQNGARTVLRAPGYCEYSEYAKMAMEGIPSMEPYRPDNSLQNLPIPYNTIQHLTSQYLALPCSMLQYPTVLYPAMIILPHLEILCNTLQYHTVPSRALAIPDLTLPYLTIP